MIRLALFLIGFLMALVSAIGWGTNGITLIGCILTFPQIVRGLQCDLYFYLPTFRRKAQL